MSRYWYFYATLPGFTFSSPPPLSSEEFLSLCRRNLMDAEYGLVTASRSIPLEGEDACVSGSGLLRSYSAWERSLRNELARLRARKAGLNEDDSVRPSALSSEAARVASAAFAMENPYEAELYLERERWKAVERMTSLSDFQLDAIIGYRLRIAIAERVQLMQRDVGSENYRILYETIVSGASRTAQTETVGEHA